MCKPPPVLRVFLLLVITLACPAFAQAQPKVSINDVTVVEGTQPGTSTSIAVFTVNLSSPLSQFLFVPIAVHDQTAKRGLDFLWNNDFAIFRPGTLTTTVQVAIIGDSLPEGDETFALELMPPTGILGGKTIGTCTILDDDNAVSPPEQRVAEGEKGQINIRLTDPAVADEKVILQTDDPTLLVVPGSVTIPAGATGVSVEFTCLNRVGAGSIMVTLPPSRGGRTYVLSVAVHDATTLTIDPIRLDLSPGGSGTVTAIVNPVPAAPLRLILLAVTSGIVSFPDTILTGADGRAIIPVRAVSSGSTIVNISLLDTDGGASSPLTVNVTGTAAVITSIVPAGGRETGGDWVAINGFNFLDHCAYSFGGIPVVDNWIIHQGNELGLLTPPHDAGFVDVEVRCGTGSFVLANGFYYNPMSVTLKSIFPTSGTTKGGTLVTFSGANLRFDSCTAMFGQTPASAVSTHGATLSISAMAPPHEAGSVPVSLVCGSETVTLPDAFHYVEGDDPPATLSTYSLTQGSVAEMVGVSFRRDDQILINGIPLADVLTPEADRHVFSVPEITGQAQLTLRDYAGRTLTRTVTVYAPPKVAYTTVPNRITLGAEFSVTGNGLRPGLTYTLGPAPLQQIPNMLINTNDRSVCGYFCDEPAVFRTPISIGPGTFSFTIADQGTVLLTQPVEVTASGPAVSTVTPQCAAPEGGSLVTIVGSGFDNGAAVQFGTTRSMEVVVKDRFTVVARVPPAFGITQPQITVFNQDGSAATLTSAFNYKSAVDGGCGGGRHRAAGR
ncbi:MAG TPA: IPT/TIG domain-containing protein [Thermoanaerobaculia bacterium]|jgi:hypothetical protein|nr:IPT/TIG domain-containing protein [Thermoanaerobaculia bacterium]